jgi:hypothetical protein
VPGCASARRSTYSVVISATASGRDSWRALRMHPHPEGQWFEGVGVGYAFGGAQPNPPRRMGEALNDEEPPISGGPFV